MKKTGILIILIVMVMSLTACEKELSTDKYNVNNIFNQDKTFVYEKIEEDNKSEIVYELKIEKDLATYSTTIAFKEGEFRSSSTFNINTLNAVKSYKGNSYYLYAEKNWDIYAKYNEFLEMEAVSKKKNETMTLALPKNYLDNESIIFSAGAIEEKKDLEINIATIEAAEVTPYSIKWLGNESIKVPYGTFDCIKVQLEYIGPVLGTKPKLELWYTNDENRYLVKYKNFNLEINLKDIIDQ